MRLQLAAGFTVRSLRLLAAILLCLSGWALLSQSQGLDSTQEQSPAVSPDSAASAGTALMLEVRDAISPATSDYLYRGLQQARELGAKIVILQLDTPGGLDLAMREIIQGIIASPVPVAIYVSPAGARAASAGTYMLYAAHIAAMAPGTNLGAATPVQIGGGGLPDMKPPSGPATEGEPEQQAEPTGEAMKRKVVNDSIAYIRSLAEMRGRNVEWAEAAVREAASLSSEEALARGVIDLMARDVEDLLRQVHGRQVEVNGRPHTIVSEGLGLQYFQPDWRNRLLAVITNPNVAYILLMIGMYGLFFEFVNPGFILPGVTGAICLLLALYALQILPVNYAGLGLIILGIMFMVGEAFVPSFGVLGIGGLVAFVIGSVILFDTRGSNMQIAWPLIGVVSAVTGGFLLIAMRLALKSFRRPVVSGAEELLGSLGTAQETFEGRGHVLVHGESWQALSEVPLARGATVRVVARHGLILQVEPWEDAT